MARAVTSTPQNGRCTTCTPPPSDELKHEAHRIASFGSSWNGRKSSIKLAGSGFYSIDQEKAECRFCARVYSSEAESEMEHALKCRMPSANEPDNIPMRTRTYSDTDGDAALAYITDRGKDIQLVTQSFGRERGSTYLPLGMLQAFIERGFEEVAIKAAIEEFFFKNGMFPDARQLFRRLVAVTSSKYLCLLYE